MWRFNSLCEMNFEVDRIDSTHRKTFILYIIFKALYKLKFGTDFKGVNKKMAQLFRLHTYDVLWIDKGVTIKPSALRNIKASSPSTILISYNPDDMFNPANQTYNYLKAIPIYDHILTSKTHNLAEFLVQGAKQVHFVQNSFEPEIHKPIILTAEEKAKFDTDVGFIGNYEKPRYESIMYLAQHDVDVIVRGPAWKKVINKHPQLKIEPTSYFGIEYAKLINATKINLGFLHKGNRDQQTTRSIEIPACRGFLLAERTAEHLALFKEGVEAEYFGSNEELKEKVIYYLHHEEKRLQIAEAGYQRCLESQYDNYHVFKKIIDSLL